MECPRCGGIEEGERVLTSVGFERLTILCTNCKDYVIASFVAFDDVPVGWTDGKVK